MHRDFVLRKGTDPCTGREVADQRSAAGTTSRNSPCSARPRCGASSTAPAWRIPMHMHLVLMQILDRQPFVFTNDMIVPTGPRVPPPANEAGWKDTVRANPNEITRVIARFDGFPGPVSLPLPHPRARGPRDDAAVPSVAAAGFHLHPMARFEREPDVHDHPNRLHTVERNAGFAPRPWTPFTNEIVGPVTASR